MMILISSTNICRADEIVYQDKKGVVRWSHDDSEVALFGANYCLPSACDYRAAGFVGGDRKQMIRDDMTHFTRLGWDALRLCLWGDWENCDVKGNLIENDHLDLLDYLIYQASERDIKMLLSSIVTYNANWPDNLSDKSMPGFSNHYKKWDLTINKEAVEAQKNYITQLLNHTNPYTGRKIKDEPNIIFVEIINEPSHRVDLEKETINYINSMYDAIRSTGCDKLVYYNISQDFRMAPIIKKTKVEGGTYAWYPTQLNIGYTLEGNFLPFVADYPQIKGADIGARSKIVYEFDAPDMTDSYMFPAMVREFRRGGVQFAAIFSYDMLSTASRNLGWQTHNINMVYTPQKAVSVAIAARAMQLLEREDDYGKYPENSQFGDFSVNYEDNLSLLNNSNELMYSNNISDTVEISDGVKRIIGYGSSPVVKTDSRGIYFLDQVKDGVWRLELYPNVLEVDDPYSPYPREDKICYRISAAKSKMALYLNDLGDDFYIQSLRSGNSYKVKGNSFTVAPDIYIISSKECDANQLPDVVNGIGMKDYVSPKLEDEFEISLFDTSKDADRVRYTRIYRSLPFKRKVVKYDNLTSGLQIEVDNILPSESYIFPVDISASHYIAEKLKKYIEYGFAPKTIIVEARALTESTNDVLIVFNQSDCKSWSAKVQLDTTFKKIEIPATALQSDLAPMLPQDWPGVNPYWYPDLSKPGDVVNWGKIENVYISMRPNLYSDCKSKKGVEIKSIKLKF